MNLQKAVIPYDWFVRCIGLGPQTRKVNYDPSAALHDRYTMDIDFLSPEDASVLEDMTLTINAFFGWDFNSCESLAKGGTWYPIDFANACPDSQVTSLHYHFPWLIKANLRWSIFCAATGQQDAQEPRLGAVLRRRRQGPRSRASGCANTRRSPTSGSRPRSSATSAASTSATSTRSPTTSSAPRRCATRCGRR